MPKKVLTGKVVSDKPDKTCLVEVMRLVKHPKYGKYTRHRTKCTVHDKDNTAKFGDIVEIVECRPMSKNKRWRFISVVEASKYIDLAQLRAEAKEEAAAKEGSL